MNKFFKDVVVQFGHSGKCKDHKSLFSFTSHLVYLSRHDRLLPVPYHCALQDARMSMVFARDCAVKFNAIDDVREPQWNDDDACQSRHDFAPTISAWDIPTGIV